MKTNAPTHDEVTQRAQEIWRQRGSPSGLDMEIWLEAERQLSIASSATSESSQGESQAAEVSNEATKETPPPPDPIEVAAKVEQQKNEARAPKLPKKKAPKAAPPESGKPLWSKPHSS